MPEDEKVYPKSILQIAKEIEKCELDVGIRENFRDLIEKESFIRGVNDLIRLVTLEPIGKGEFTLDPNDPEQCDDNRLRLLRLIDRSDLGILDIQHLPDEGVPIPRLAPLIEIVTTEKLGEILEDDPEINVPKKGAFDDYRSFIRGEDQRIEPAVEVQKEEVLGKRFKSEEEYLDFDHSRQLDVHTWSDHPEVNVFVDAIYEEHFPPGGKVEIKKRHLKVVLLDLYLAWSDDPDLKVAYHRNRNAYEGRTRYNELHISPTTIDIADKLIEAGLIDHRLGFKDRREGGQGRISRMWPTEALIKRFQEAKWGPLDIGGYEDRETIILRKGSGENKKDIPYDDTDETNRMRAVLRDYNSLLRRTFIDIPELDRPIIELKADQKGKTRKLYVNQRDKFVRRIFNRGSFNKGGRFYGGWWQRCPKEWRAKIFVNDRATSEIDYSGLHPVMLYGREGIDYWKDIKQDPYAIPKPDFLESDEQTRAVAKLLLLVAINAKDDRSAFGAFRGQSEAGSPEKRLTNDQLGTILGALRERHAPIADQFASDKGIDLQNMDARVTEGIIQHFTDQGIPILTIHDSYIVPVGLEEELEAAMQESFSAVTGIRNMKLKEETERPDAIFERHEQRRALDLRNPALLTLMAADMNARIDPPRSDRYKRDHQQFRERREDVH